MRMIASIVALVFLAAACSSNEPKSRHDEAMRTAASAPTRGRYRPAIDPDDFVREIDNRYFPLEPGTVIKLRGDTEDGVEQERIVVTDRTREVMGVTTTVVKDIMRVEGELAEVTEDWYAQDVEGNVWYFGEDTAEYENGKPINTHGSWEAGVDGALPGIIMSADPQVTDSYRQEFYKDEAEDMFWVVETGLRKSVPLGAYDDVVHVLEWTPLEPRIVVEKFYAPGVGLLSETALSGGKENVELLEITKP
ncbi:MAG TPA: hypothetical protein VJ927_09315 [Actinomycetota bacterium]|nr:hypothetical protein [Actinomycetota bacterium]